MSKCLKWIERYEGQVTVWVGERSVLNWGEERRGEQRRCVETNRAEDKQQEQIRVLLENYGFAVSKGRRQISVCFCSPLELTVLRGEERRAEQRRGEERRRTGNDNWGR